MFRLVIFCRALSKSQQTGICQQMLDAVKHVADDSFAFQPDSAPVHYVRNTVQLLRSKIIDFLSPDLSYGANSPNMNPINYKIQGVIIAARESTRSKKSNSSWLMSGKAVIWHFSNTSQNRATRSIWAIGLPSARPSICPALLVPARLSFKHRKSRPVATHRDSPINIYIDCASFVFTCFAR